MELVILTMAPGPGAIHGSVSAESLADILWANAVPGDRLEHLRVQPDQNPGELAVGLLLLPHPDIWYRGDSAQYTGMRLCRTAIATSPLLSGWSVVLFRPDHPARKQERRD